MTSSIFQGDSIYVQEEEISLLKEICKQHNIDFEKYFNRSSGLFFFPKSFVGYLTLLDRKILIRPRFVDFSLQDVFLMKLITFGYRAESILGKGFSNLIESTGIESIAELYFRELNRLISRGIPRKFIPLEKRTNNFSGKVNFTKSLYNFKKQAKNPVLTVKDSLSANIEVNWLLAKALEKIKKLLPTGNYNRARSFLPEILPRDNDFINRIQLTRASVHASVCVELAKMIVFNLNSSRIKGDKWGESFLINYDILFENFIYKVLSTSNSQSHLFEKPKTESIYGEYVLDGINKKKFLPDILFDKKNSLGRTTCGGVLDVKNKYPKIFTNSDIFQLLYYCYELKSNIGILVYPSLAANETVKLEFTNADNEVSIYAVYFNVKTLSNGDFEREQRMFCKKVLSVLYS